LAIQKLARQTGGDVQELQTLYVLEALLSRIAISEHRDDFVLKGGVLLAAFAARRPTKDIDLQATGFGNDAREVADLIRVIAAIELSDGIVFEPASISASAIRDSDADEYPGVRIKLVGTLGSARLTVGIDVNFGDPIWPAPQVVELPRIVALDLPPVAMLGYPLAMVLAEKLVTAIDRGEGNTRWRDFADVYTLTGHHAVDPDDLRASMDAVASYRGVALTSLLPQLQAMPERAQPKWRAWRTRVGREHELPEQFGDVLNTVGRFADPVLTGQASGVWNSDSRTWS
jgi:hypothetical protein